MQVTPRSNRTALALGALSLGLIAVTLGSATAQAQSKMPMSASSSSSGKDPYHGFNVSMPIVNLNKEMIIHLEANLGGAASLSLEGIFKGAYDEIDEDETVKTGETRSSTAKGVSLLFSRYSNPNSMSGIYFGIGVGYREESVDWRVRPDANDPKSNYALVDPETQLLNHDGKLSGTTGSFRVGYRYVGDEWPVSAGGYIGARHFQAGVSDVDAEHTKIEDNIPLADMTDHEKDSLRRSYATRPECGIEIGFRF